MGKVLRKIINKLKYRESEQAYINVLKSKGIKIGAHTVFFDWKSNVIDMQRPWLLEIGDYCKITHGVIILTHDYSRSVMRRVYGEVVDGARPTIIGDNVFIGINAVILMGANIGNNVIVGAGSVVKGTIPDNVVVAGNPAHIICTLEEYYLKRKMCYVDEAKECLRIFVKKYKRVPSIEEMGAFFPIYLKRDREELKKHNIRTKLSGDEEMEVISCFLKSKGEYSSYDDFVTDALNEFERNMNESHWF